MLLDNKPVLSEVALQELERTRSMDPYAQYFFVFVTMKGIVLDLRHIPKHVLGRFKWYQLEMVLDLHPRGPGLWFE